MGPRKEFCLSSRPKKSHSADFLFFFPWVFLFFFSRARAWHPAGRPGPCFLGGGGGMVFCPWAGPAAAPAAAHAQPIFLGKENPRMKIPRARLGPRLPPRGRVFLGRPFFQWPPSPLPADFRGSLFLWPAHGPVPRHFARGFFQSAICNVATRLNVRPLMNSPPNNIFAMGLPI